ncbi:MAG: L-lysine 6-transaminase [Candidatus Aminicenantes bacterium]|nr:L-lysine 6-transaminase [Candidatus Aminicenantes bacterium]
MGMQSDWWSEISPDMGKSYGSYLHDVCTGQDFLDFMTFFATSPISYNHPSLLDPEFKEKIGKIALHNPSNSDFWTDEMAGFVTTFRTAMGKTGRDFPHFFIVSGGALAVENALKAAFDWKIKKNIGFENLSFNDIQTNWSQKPRLTGDRVICFEEAFHGRSGYTLSLTHTYDRRKYMFFPKFNDWVRVSNPKINHPLEKNLSDVVEAEKRTLKEIRDIINQDSEGGRSFAAIIIEPVQGEGGDNHFRAEFFEGLRNIADEYNILLIYDEVQTGMGLTGAMWCFEHFGEKAKPDIICFGKKYQVCGILASRKLDEVRYNAFSEERDPNGIAWGKSRLNSTWGGNWVDMIRCQKYLEIIMEENLIKNAAEMGNLFMKGLLSLQEKYQDILTNVRGRGLMAAVDLCDYAGKKAPQIRDMLKNKIKENHMLVLPSGQKGMRFRAHLDVTSKELEHGLEILENSIKAIKA